MPKEKSINPAQAERKKEKAKAVKKGKAEAQSRRTEKLARRNPERLQRQFDELKALQSSGSKLTTHETRVLEELERDLKAVRKARETLGDRAPTFRRDGDGAGRDGGRGGGRAAGVLGKRRRDGSDGSGSDSGSDIPDDVRRIPMPRDTPPPVPREVLDKWHAKRRERWARHHDRGDQGRANAGTSANSMPLGANARFGSRDREEGGEGGTRNEGRQEVLAPAQTVYEAKAVIRDLRKEAVSAFVPAAVRVKMEKAKGKGGLVEPEEADQLEKWGYLGGGEGEGESGGGEVTRGPRAVEMEEIEDEDD